MFDRKKIGKRVKELRQVLNLKQDEFASKLGVTNNYISLIEVGKKKPGMEVLTRMMDVFNVNVTYLFYGEGDLFREPNVSAALPEFVRMNTFDDNLTAQQRTEKLIWLIRNIPLVQYAMLESFLVYYNDKQSLIDKEIKKFLEKFQNKEE